MGVPSRPTGRTNLSRLLSVDNDSTLSNQPFCHYLFFRSGVGCTDPDLLVVIGSFSCGKPMRYDRGTSFVRPPHSVLFSPAPPVPSPGNSTPDFLLVRGRDPFHKIRVPCRTYFRDSILCPTIQSPCRSVPLRCPRTHLPPPSSSSTPTSSLHSPFHPSDLLPQR